MEHFADVDAYLDRAELWPDEIRALRPILTGCGLDEAIKWGKPCYVHEGRNIVILQEMKHFLAVMFFKGALLADPAGVLEAQGPNSRSARRICVRSTGDVGRLADVVRAYVAAAIDVEDAGLEVPAAPDTGWVDELQQRLDRDPAFKRAFEALTPGRQREYHLQISSAKQATTRAARVAKYADRILAGKGFRER
jgi:uncharacterized protein YdeI (YjbR/CyaY-like superfamily)